MKGEEPPEDPRSFTASKRQNVLAQHLKEALMANLNQFCDFTKLIGIDIAKSQQLAQGRAAQLVAEERYADRRNHQCAGQTGQGIGELCQLR